VVEAMKMENEVPSPKTGRVVALEVVSGQTVEKGPALLRGVRAPPAGKNKKRGRRGPPSSFQEQGRDYLMAAESSLPGRKRATRGP